MKEILFSFSTTNLGGAEYQAYNLIKALDRKKYKIEVLVFLENGKISEWYKKDRIKVTCLEGYKIGKIKMLKRLNSFFKNNKYDIIYTFGYNADILTRFITTFHKKNNYLISAKRSVDANRSKIKVLLDRLTSRRIKYYISNSKSAIELLKNREKISEKKIKYIPNGVDLEKFIINKSKKELRRELKLPENKFIIINLANLRPVKNQILLLEAVKELYRINEDFFLIILGEGRERNNLENYISNNKLENNCILLGRKENIEEYLNASDIFVLTSKWEGMPGSIMESMACSIPVISTDVGDVRELIEDNKNGFVLKNFLKENIKEKILYFFYNKKEVQEFGKKSKEKIKKFSFTEMIKKHEKIFDEE